jgi:hypothetical protein
MRRSTVLSLVLVAYFFGTFAVVFGAIVALKFEWLGWRDVMPWLGVWALGGAGVMWLLAVRTIRRLEQALELPGQHRSRPVR